MNGSRLIGKPSSPKASKNGLTVLLNLNTVISAIEYSTSPLDTLTMECARARAGNFGCFNAKEEHAEGVAQRVTIRKEFQSLEYLWFEKLASTRANRHAEFDMNW